MKIILLSGGSGKRLWPLSNDLRAKQFLQLLKREDGQYESMIQRIYRQIKSVQTDAHVVVVTGQAQSGLVKKQLGSEVDMVIEPERRDTFPAIALACMYLLDAKEIESNEVVAVIPVDPYTDINYFSTLYLMEKAAKSNIADIILMGISPSCASEKYGYIVPDRKIEVKDTIETYVVKKFVEKPSLEKAQSLIHEGARWNGGVFVFKLGYLQEIIEQYVPVKSYSQIKNQYKNLAKNSFDYEVVEKAQSVAMVPYDGKWSDLGTWDSFSEKLDTTIGQVVLGEETGGTTVINDGTAPVVVLGAKNMIIAVSSDGILVADKEKSNYLKSYVTQFPTMSVRGELEWGDYQVSECMHYEDNKQSITRHLTIWKDHVIEYHAHKMRDEIWVITDGDGEVVIDGKYSAVHRGNVIMIRSGQKHALKAHCNIRMVEIQIGENLKEDTEEFQWIW